MSIATDYESLQRQLFILGYSQHLPIEGVELVSTLLRDLQASLNQVKELEQGNARLEKDERVTKASSEKYKGELQWLRTENNSLRTDVLNYSKQLDRVRREARSEVYEMGKKLDEVKAVNLQLKAEKTALCRKADELSQRLEQNISAQELSSIPVSRIAQSHPLEPTALGPGSRPRAEPAAIELIDLSSNRINALEEELCILEGKLDNTASELRSSRLDVQERDLEILRLNTEIERETGGRRHTTLVGDAPIERLNDQVDYLHSQASTLERKNQEQQKQFSKEREDMHKRWVSVENERTRLLERIKQLESELNKHNLSNQPSSNPNLERASSFPPVPRHYPNTFASTTASSTTPSLSSSLHSQSPKIGNNVSDNDMREALKSISETVAHLKRDSRSPSAGVLIDQIYTKCQKLLSEIKTPPVTEDLPPKRHMHRGSSSESEDRERLQTELSNTRSLYEQTRDQLQDLLRKKNSETRREVKEARDQAEKASEAESAARRELETLRTESMKEISELKHKIASAPDHLQKLEERERKVSYLEKRLNKLMTTLDREREEARESIESLERDLQTTREELHVVQHDLDHRASQYDSSLAEYKKLVELNKKLDKSLKHAVEEVNATRARSTDLEYKGSELMRKLEEYKLMYQQVANKLKSNRQALDAATKELAELREAHSDHDRKIEQLTQDIEQAEKLRRATEMSKNEYKQQLVKCLSECESHKSLASHLQAERSALKVQVKAQFHLNQRLEQRLEYFDHRKPSGMNDGEYKYESRQRLGGSRASRTGSASGSSSTDTFDVTLPPRPAYLSSPILGARRNSRTSSAEHSSRSFEGLAGSRSRSRRSGGDRDDEDPSTLSSLSSI